MPFDRHQDNHFNGDYRFYDKNGDEICKHFLFRDACRYNNRCHSSHDIDDVLPFFEDSDIVKITNATGDNSPFINGFYKADYSPGYNCANFVKVGDAKCVLSRVEGCEVKVIRNNIVLATSTGRSNDFWNLTTWQVLVNGKMIDQKPPPRIQAANEAVMVCSMWINAVCMCMCM
jgi:hypothetical protein